MFYVEYSHCRSEWKYPKTLTYSTGCQNHPMFRNVHVLYNNENQNRDLSFELGALYQILQ